jgi:hypothetical protein
MTIRLSRWEWLYADPNHTRAVGLEYRSPNGRGYLRVEWGPIKIEWRRARISGGFMLRPAQVWFRVARNVPGKFYSFDAMLPFAKFGDHRCWLGRYRWGA